MINREAAFAVVSFLFPTHDALVAFERRLIACRPKTCLADGHDVGSGTVNVFVYTTAPEAAHRAFRKFLGMNAVEKRLRVAYGRPRGRYARANFGSRTSDAPLASVSPPRVSACVSAKCVPNGRASRW